jgi:hypothetical protein
MVMTVAARGRDAAVAAMQEGRGVLPPWCTAKVDFTTARSAG